MITFFEIRLCSSLEFKFEVTKVDPYGPTVILTRTNDIQEAREVVRKQVDAGKLIERYDNMGKQVI